MNKLPYYPHIDGLRGVAVLLVILFHYGLGAPGGYVGVDVFFVISGFLITSIVMRDREAGTFRVRNFWERRARRILPALIVVVAASALAGWFLFLPGDFRALGESVLAQTVFLQNAVFWQDSGYFAIPSEAKPLLHTWSLAVEEQFYLGLPLILLLLRRWQIATLRGLFIVAAVISFVLGIAGLRYFPSAAFFLLPTRAWELLAGILIALGPIGAGPKWVSEVGSTLGLAAVLVAGFWFDAATPFPGWAALLPVGGTAALIFFTRERSTWCARVLTFKPMVFIGLISYSLYLWHWPLLVFFKTWSLDELAFPEKIGLTVLALGFATLSWRFVESPVRRRTIFSTGRSVLALTGGCLVFCLLVGLGAIVTEGAPGRLSPALLRYANGSQDAAFLNELQVRDVQAGALVPFGSRDRESVDVVVWGDSLAMALLPGLDQYCGEQHLAGAAATHSATPPLVGFVGKSVYSLGDEGVPFGKAVIDFVQDKHPRHVVLMAAWSGYLGRPSDPDFARKRQEFSDAVSRTIVALSRNGAQVWVVTEPPRFGNHIPKILARRELFGFEPGSLLTSEDKHRHQQAEVEKVFSEVLPGHARLMDVSVFLRDGKGGFLIEADGYPLYRDHIHLSTHGANFIKSSFAPLAESP